MKSFGRLALLSTMLFALELQAQPDQEQLLSADAYPQPLEEVVVTAAAPEWRKPQQTEWRPQRFELQQGDIEPRMEWFPPYLLDERDNMTTVNNRMDEKAGIKIWELRF